MKSETKNCQNCKKNFIIEPDDFSFYEKIKVPPPTFCPECRVKRRLMWRNERNFYYRKCSLCQKNIVSSYNSGLKFPVYCQKCWWGDKWDPYQYGQDFDFSRPFFEQFRELIDKVPMLGMQNDDGIASLNCEYIQDFAFSKNCYLTAAGWYCDNVMYSYYTCYDTDVMDSYFINHSEKCYECFESHRISACKYCHLCFDSVDLMFCYDLRGCNNCFMCTGLRNKSYYIRNKLYSREDYLKELKKENINSRKNIEKFKKEFIEIKLKIPHKFSPTLKSIKCTGHMIFESKMSKDCFWVNGLENCRYLMNVDGAKDCYDVNNTGRPNLCYECVTPDNCYNCSFNIFCWKGNDVFYSYNCHSCNNCFGCIGLRHSEYSIFNKKYSKEEYFKIKNEIITHMKKTEEYGEFFPINKSIYSYNESFCVDYFPMSEEEAKKLNLAWRKEEKKNYQITITSEKLPDEIKDVDDSILNEIIKCEHDSQCSHSCATAFKVVERELMLYRKLNIPIPILCPNCRYFERVKQRNPLKLWHRKCMKKGCTNEFETSYAPERSEIVYCERCYQNEMY